jgi:hypothetical protein
MQNLTILTILYIVYGSSIADENSEVSESEVNQFLALPASPLLSAYPRLLRRHRRIIVDKISE